MGRGIGPRMLMYKALSHRQGGFTCTGRVQMMANLEASRKLDLKLDLRSPDLDELAPIIRDSLQHFFQTCSVDIVDCPDLTQAPYNLSGSIFGPDLRIAEVGGVGNLYPRIRRDKLYNLKAICDLCDMSTGFVFGPGAGPRTSVGVNCEMVADANFERGIVNTRIGRLDGDGFIQETTCDPCFGVLANLAVSPASPSTESKVLRIRAKQRIDKFSFPEAIRQTLFRHYRAKLVSMAGVFVQEEGTARVHIMPDFPEKDFASWEEERSWLRHFPARAPLVCCSVIHSLDPHLDLRLEHTHCYSAHGDVGHYYTDTSPELAEFEGFFAPARFLYRIDQIDTQGREK